MTLRSQLVLAAAYILVVVVIAFEVPIALNLDKRGVAEFRSEVLGQTAVAAGRIADAVNGAAPATKKGARERPIRLPTCSSLPRSSPVRPVRAW